MEPFDATAVRDDADVPSVVLRVVQLLGHPAPREISARFIAPDGGTIGRSLDNTLPLPDPLRQISRVHARVSWHEDRWHIECLSQSGPVLVNEVAYAIGEPCALQDGDTVAIAGFELRAELPRLVSPANSERDADPTVILPRASSAPVDDLDALFGLSQADDLLSARSPLPPLNEASSQPARPAAPPLQVPSLQVPPLQAPMPATPMPAAPKPAAPKPAAPKPAAPMPAAPMPAVSTPSAPRPSVPIPVAPKPAMLKPAVPLPAAYMPTVTPVVPLPARPMPLTPSSEALRPPRTSAPVEVPLFSPESAVWKNGPPTAVPPVSVSPASASPAAASPSKSSAAFAAALAAADAARARQTSITPAPIEPMEPIGPEARNGSPEAAPLSGVVLSWQPDEVADPFKDAHGSLPGAHDTFPGVVPSDPGSTSRSLSPAAPGDPLPLAASEPPGQAELLQRFLRGARLPDLPRNGDGPAPSTLSPELIERLGEMLRVTTEGTIELIQARAMVKREMRADVTMIAARQNNPLKFSPDAAAALANLLRAEPVRGFLDPVAALRDAFDDLLAHQVGFVAGMRAAMQGVVERFDPAHIAADLPPSAGLSTLMPNKRKAQLWDRFSERYALILREAEDNFESFFGREFVRAYEEQIDLLHRPVEPSPDDSHTGVGRMDGPMSDPDPDFPFSSSSHRNPPR